MVKGKFDSEIKSATRGLDYSSGEDAPRSAPIRARPAKPAAKKAAEVKARQRTMPGEHIFRQTLKGSLKLNRRLERNFMNKKGGDSLLAAKQMFTAHYNDCRAFEQHFKDIYNQTEDVELVFPHADPFSADAVDERVVRLEEEHERAEAAKVEAAKAAAAKAAKQK